MVCIIPRDPTPGIPRSGRASPSARRAERKDEEGKAEGKAGGRAAAASAPTHIWLTSFCRKAALRQSVSCPETSMPVPRSHRLRPARQPPPQPQRQAQTRKPSAASRPRRKRNGDCGNWGASGGLWEMESAGAREPHPHRAPSRPRLTAAAPRRVPSLWPYCGLALQVQGIHTPRGGRARPPAT